MKDRQEKVNKTMSRYIGEKKMIAATTNDTCIHSINEIVQDKQRLLFIEYMNFTIF